ncbi:MAG: TIM barrel protein [Sedimentisphaerales bacterium]|nr:TIM barrel protein [Sedimentisphaerales bacterium]
MNAAEYDEMKTLGILFAILLFAAEGLPQPIVEVRPTVYSHLLDPTLYPDYTRRPSRAPTWATFEGRPQFVALRTLPTAAFTNQGLGTVCMPTIDLASDPNLGETLDELKRRGYYLFDVGGYVPGSVRNQIRVPPETLQLLEEKLGDRFLGFDIGEQDGRYLFTARAIQSPYASDRLGQYLQAHDYFRRIEDDLGNRLNALMVYWYWPYLIKEGRVVLTGAEAQNKVTSSSIHYAFLRGAGKQYGVHWFGNGAVFNTWHYKDYQARTANSGPTKGNSLNLLRRLMFSHYLCNSVILGFEGALYEKSWWPPNGDGPLSPLGLIQQDAVKFVTEHPQPGVMHAPVALLLDHFAGWMPARTWTTAYRVWGYLPYGSGDYLTHSVFSMLYLGYEDSAWYHDERGTICNTPYGDVADVLHSDAMPWVMKQYGVMVAAGDLFTADAELRDKLDAYVASGGTFIVTAENARRLWPEWKVGQPRRFPTDTVVVWRDGTRTTERHTMELCDVFLPGEAEVLARCGELPAVVRLRRGAGEIFLLLSPFGINAEPTVQGELAHHSWNQPLPQPHTLLAHVRRVLDSGFRSQQLFSVGDDLGFITCRKGPGDYTVGVFNNSLQSKPFKITSRYGPIRKVTELVIGKDMRSALGYWPHEFQNNDGGRSDAANISGGDVRLFSVLMDETGVRVLAKQRAPGRPVDRLLGLRGIADLREEILRRPTFFEHFDGVKLDWTYLLRRDSEQVKRDRPWLERQQLRVVVDFTSGLNHFPDLTLLDLLPTPYAESVARMDDVLAKMKLAGVSQAVIATHMPPEFGATPEEVEASFKRGLRDLCRRAKERGIMLHLQNRTGRWHSSVPEIVRLIDELASDNLRFALNTACADVENSLKQAGDRLGMVLISAPDRLVPETQRPVGNSGVDLSAVRTLQVPVVLDGEYAGPDDVFKDVTAVWGPPAKGLKP